MGKINRTLESLTDTEVKVLAILHTAEHPGFGYGNCYFPHDFILSGGYLINEGIEKEVSGKKGLSKVLKSLRDKGLVNYMNGLMTEDGEVAGSGNAPEALYEDEIEEFLDQRGML